MWTVSSLVKNKTKQNLFKAKCFCVSLNTAGHGKH